MVAPNGKGCASDWVLSNYPEAVGKRRSKNFQKNLGLLVHIDGDEHGVTARKTALDVRLQSKQMPLRGPSEPVAIFVPTWCIETWLLHLAGLEQPRELDKLKRDPDPTYRAALHALAEDEARYITTAVATWPGSGLPSLMDSKTEGGRIGI